MFKVWKYKIKEFFKDGRQDVQVKREKQRNIYAGQLDEIRAKVTYKYPNNMADILPSPDRNKRKPTSNYPTNKGTQIERDTHEPKIEPVEERYLDEKKIYKKVPNKPFRPSNVASPIYGYRDSNEARMKEEDVRNNITMDSGVRSSEKESSEKNFDQVIDNQLINRVDQHEESSSSVNQQLQKDNNEQSLTLSQNIVDRSDGRGSSKDKTVGHIEKENMKELQISNKEKEKKFNAYSQKRNLSKENQEKGNIVPYNVMMTTDDKRKLSSKSLLNHSHRSTVNNNHRSFYFPLHLLNDPYPKGNDNNLWVSDQQRLLEKTLRNFKVRANVVHIAQGPTVTRFEVQPEMGVKVSKIKNLSDDLKLNMAAKDIRIEAPIPGKNTIGIEVPNNEARMVGLQEILDNELFKHSSSLLTIALGLNIEGNPVITNIEKMPHGLIAGATGSGKSVCINTIILSLLYKVHYEDVKLLLIDPKMVELAPYNGLPHLISPVITDVKAATAALKWAVGEMETRYDQFVTEGVRDIKRYNEKMKMKNRFDERIPYIVIVIDELADLMMASPQDVEEYISRIAQKARACGIHLLLATQRPSVDVITGLIKANVPTRIAFSVSSQIDSRTIIDTAGAEKLLGKGDMLFVENGAGKSIRLQGAFVSDEEIERVTSYVRNLAPPNYLFEQDTLLESYTFDEEEDELLQIAIKFVLEQNSASTSLLQRHFKIGYNRAARLIDSMENKGIISGQNGSKPRTVLISKANIE